MIERYKQIGKILYFLIAFALVIFAFTKHSGIWLQVAILIMLLGNIIYKLSQKRKK